MNEALSLREIRFGSPEYSQECVLRQAVLRAPLGLDLFAEDLAPEADQWHFGLFAPDGALVGCVIAVPLGDGHAKLRQMAVLPRRQRQGLGRRLLREVEAVLASRGIRHIVLHARLAATGFYDASGYARVGQVFTEVTIPHVRMEKSLGEGATP
jgi:ribosomal protein S18 acetylase RimI-like enzyme